MMVFTGKGYGETNLIAMDDQGEFSRGEANPRRSSYRSGAGLPEWKLAHLLFL